MKASPMQRLPTKKLRRAARLIAAQFVANNPPR
jgi:hypothetical protein